MVNHTYNYKNDSQKNSSVKYDIVTVGSAVIDAFITTQKSQTEIFNIHDHKDVCYPIGAKILVEHLEFFTGGGGTNTAVAFSRIGLKTGFLGKIGNDLNSGILLEELKKENVEFVGRRGNTSGYSVILDALAHDRTVFAYKGCNDELKLSTSDISKIDTHSYYFSSMLKDSLKSQERIAKYAGSKGILVAYNPSLYLAIKGYKYLKKILDHTTILILNLEEAKAILRHRNSEMDNENKSNGSNIYLLLQELCDKGPIISVITNGHEGVHCYDSRDKIYYSAPAKKIKVVESTGAGDAFASGFVAGILLALDIPTSLKMGMKNAESVIQYRGAKNVLLGPELVNIAKKDTRNIIKRINIKI